MPIPRTSYVVAVINYIPAGQRAEPTKAGISCGHEGLATYHDNASASKRTAIKRPSKHSQRIPHAPSYFDSIDRNAVLADAGLFAGFPDRGAARRRRGRGCFSGRLSVHQCNAALHSPKGALNAALVPTYLRVRETEGKVAAAAFAGRALGCVSLILICIALALTLLMPLVISLSGAGFRGQRVPAARNRQRAIDDALFRIRGTIDRDDRRAERRASLSAHRVFAGAVQSDAHRCARGVAGLAARSAVFSNRHCRRRGRRRMSADADPGAATALARRRCDTAADFIRSADPRLPSQRNPRNDRQCRPAVSDRQRRDHCVVIACSGLVALFCQSPD